jgi:hypothetical protein
MKLTQGANMAAEPVSGGIASAIGWKALGLGTLIGSGVLGAVMMAVFDPPKSKKAMFGQAAVAGISSLFFGPLAVKTLDHYVDWIALHTATPLEALEVAAPVYLLIGALSWGVFGGLAKLREIIRQRGGDYAAGKLGLPAADKSATPEAPKP